MTSLMQRKRTTMCKDALSRIALATSLALASATFAQDNSSLINQQLDQPVKIQFDTMLPDAMSTIAKKTGVRVEADQAVWDLLPWGQQTNINARIENQTLRQAMDVITRKLGLQYALKEQSIELQPMPALRRIGRRATVQELQTLDFVASRPIGLKVDRVTVKELAAAVDAQLAAAKSPVAVEYRDNDAVRPDKTIFVPRNATLADALDSITKETALTWYPWEKTILIVTKEQQVRGQLAKTITMRCAGVDVSQVLTDLSRRAGVRFEVEPGALQRVPGEVRNINLTLENTSITQALDSIAGFTGLGYVVTPRGVYLWNQSYQTPASGRDPVIGTITLADSGVQIFIHESQVPPDMREYFKFRREKELEKTRHLMVEQGFRTTTTQPTTAPTSQQNEDL